MKTNSPICAFTGHRASKLPWKYNINDKRCLEFKKVLRNEILKLVDDGVTIYVTGCQNGADLICGEMVLEIKRTMDLNIKLISVLPYEGIADNWNETLRNRFFDMVCNSDEEVILSNRYYDGSYTDRNKYMLSRASHLIAVYDGKYVSRQGNGTLHTVNHAHMLNREIIIINPTTLDVNKYHV